MENPRLPAAIRGSGILNRPASVPWNALFALALSHGEPTATGHLSRTRFEAFFASCGFDRNLNAHGVSPLFLQLLWQLHRVPLPDDAAPTARTLNVSRRLWSASTVGTKPHEGDRTHTSNKTGHGRGTLPSPREAPAASPVSSWSDLPRSSFDECRASSGVPLSPRHVVGLPTGLSPRPPPAARRDAPAPSTAPFSFLLQQQQQQQQRGQQMQHQQQLQPQGSELRFLCSVAPQHAVADEYMLLDGFKTAVTAVAVRAFATSRGTNSPRNGGGGGGKRTGGAQNRRRSTRTPSLQAGNTRGEGSGVDDPFSSASPAPEPRDESAGQIHARMTDQQQWRSAMVEVDAIAEASTSSTTSDDDTNNVRLRSPATKMTPNREDEALAFACAVYFSPFLASSIVRSDGVVSLHANENLWNAHSNHVLRAIIAALMPQFSRAFQDRAPGGFMTFNVFRQFLQEFGVAPLVDEDLLLAIFSEANTEDTLGLESGTVANELELDELVTAFLMLAIAAYADEDHWPNLVTIQAKVWALADIFAVSYRSVYEEPAAPFAPDVEAITQEDALLPWIGVVVPNQAYVEGETSRSAPDKVFVAGFHFLDVRKARPMSRAGVGTTALQDGVAALGDVGVHHERLFLLTSSSGGGGGGDGSGGSGSESAKASDSPFRSGPVGRRRSRKPSAARPSVSQQAMRLFGSGTTTALFADRPDPAFASGERSDGLIRQALKGSALSVSVGMEKALFVWFDDVPVRAEGIRLNRVQCTPPVKAMNPALVRNVLGVTAGVLIKMAPDSTHNLDWGNASALRRRASTAARSRRMSSALAPRCSLASLASLAADRGAGEVATPLLGVNGADTPAPAVCDPRSVTFIVRQVQSVRVGVSRSDSYPPSTNRIPMLLEFNPLRYTMPPQDAERVAELFLRFATLATAATAATTTAKASAGAPSPIQEVHRCFMTRGSFAAFRAAFARYLPNVLRLPNMGDKRADAPRLHQTQQRSPLQPLAPPVRNETVSWDALFDIFSFADGLPKRDVVTCVECSVTGGIAVQHLDLRDAGYAVALARNTAGAGEHQESRVLSYTAWLTVLAYGLLGSRDEATSGGGGRLPPSPSEIAGFILHLCTASQHHDNVLASLRAHSEVFRGRRRDIPETTRLAEEADRCRALLPRHPDGMQRLPFVPEVSSSETPASTPRTRVPVSPPQSTRREARHRKRQDEDPAAFQIALQPATSSSARSGSAAAGSPSASAAANVNRRPTEEQAGALRQRMVDQATLQQRVLSIATSLRDDYLGTPSSWKTLFKPPV